MTSLSTTKKETIYLDGNTLDVDSLVLLSSGKYNIDLTEESWNKVKAGREVVDEERRLWIRRKGGRNGRRRGMDGREGMISRR